MTTNQNKVDIKCNSIEKIYDLGDRREIILYNTPELIFTYEAQSSLDFKFTNCINKPLLVNQKYNKI
jgi:hypothetical protein